MSILGIMLLVMGVILFFVQRYQKQKFFSLKTARSATVAELETLAREIAQEIGGGSFQDYVKLRGIIRCDQPLISELKQQPCVYYRMIIEREYEETVTRQDDQGNPIQKIQRGRETLSSNSQSIPFLLQDRTGSIQVNPNGADIETVNILNEFRQNKTRTDTISWGNCSMELRNNAKDSCRTLGYRYRESILPIERQAFVLARVSDNIERLILEKPQESGQKFIISLKNEQELSRTAQKTAKYTLYGMIFCISFGVVMLVIDLLF